VKKRNRNYDLIVIGGGSAGYAAARTAVSHNATTAVIECGPVGGLCILRGCMPSKAVLRSAEVMALMRRAKEFGLRASNLSARLDEIIARKRRLIEEFASHRREQLERGGFDFILGRARFVDAHTIEVGANQLCAKSVVIATGSIPAKVDIEGLEEVGYWTSDDALEATRLPKSLVVLGGGSVALELSQYFLRLGSRVTLIQRSSRVLKHADDDAARVIEDKFRDEGMRVFTDTKLIRVFRQRGLKCVEFLHKGKRRQARGGQILHALGRVPNVHSLRLERAGVKLTNGIPTTNARQQTNVPHIYAVGDVSSDHQIVHIAVQQGELAAHNATNRRKRAMDYRVKVEAVFTDPQIAWVGLTEQHAPAHHIPHLVASYPFSELGKAMVMGETRGFVKILAQPKTGLILGASIVGPEASDLIHELIAMMHLRATVFDLASMPHYHPTLAEILTYPAEELAAKMRRR
jgi:pyruvate/2-oxoglutarate dehydrogenase complex dihydrolipoamide dehydrogenase (E3) component